MKSSFLIVAPMSGSGKTTIARGLMALLTQRGYTVQPFKCGPDYIDTKFHAAVCGRPSINLDTFMATPEHVRELFAHYGSDADICIVEGMMGLFDGYDRERGSSYEIARVLDIPVVLVVDARSAAYSMAALLSGFVNFRSDVRFAGVLFNKVGSERHFEMLRQTCDDLGICCLGYLPKAAELEQGSRYLGLDFSQQPESVQLLSLLELHVDWQALVGNASERCVVGNASARYNNSNTARLEVLPTASQRPEALPTTSQRSEALPTTSQRSEALPTMVARNRESFSFIYQETLDRLGDVTFFDPETDVPDLDGIGLLYLPGGYPEKHIEALSANEACRKAIADYAERGGRIIAECGGMMYLCRCIVTDDGDYPACGVLPYSISARKADRRLSLGYRQFTLDGKEYRGHEFHYTQFLGEQPPSATQVYDAKGREVDTPVMRYKNVLASYTHIYI